jgi:hypothetical protein
MSVVGMKQGRQGVVRRRRNDPRIERVETGVSARRTVKQGAGVALVTLSIWLARSTLQRRAYPHVNAGAVRG